MRPRTFIPVYLSLIVGCALLLPACGNKGPLTLPPSAAAPRPAAPKAAPADQPAKPADNNSASPAAKP